MPFFLLRPPGAKQQKIIFGFLPTKKVHLALSLSLSVSTILCFCPFRKASFVRQNGASELPDLLFLVFLCCKVCCFMKWVREAAGRWVCCLFFWDMGIIISNMYFSFADVEKEFLVRLSLNKDNQLWACCNWLLQLASSSSSSSLHISPRFAVNIETLLCFALLLQLIPSVSFFFFFFFFLGFHPHICCCTTLRKKLQIWNILFRKKVHILQSVLQVSFPSAYSFFYLMHTHCDAHCIISINQLEALIFVD
jgi:hypothetical protein